QARAYPIDGFETTGIRRLAFLHQVVEGRSKGPVLPPGARRSIADIRLNLEGDAGRDLDRLPSSDPGLQARIDALFPNRDESYSLVVLEITPGRPVRLAARQADRSFSPGSVGKLAIAAGIFTELGRMFPDAPERRRNLLRERQVAAGGWIHIDTHDVPVFDPETGSFASRPVRDTDVFSLYEWMDHMLSASANAAGSVVWKELLLMRRFGADYPPTAELEQRFFDETPKTDLRDMAMSVVNDPLRAIGISQQQWQLGSFFTAAGKRRVPPGGKSGATPEGLMRFLVALEQGRVVDPWSSLEIKRLMYMTAKRIRYASSPALNEAAVYYKSGSLYRCKPETNFKCRKYQGNVENVMNSVAIVEQPDGRVYLVTVMSDVLYKNSAVEHQSLATFIDRILKQ
ncbi:MAG: serine hydrolase, partial [Deltaproteobacteria bacterium]|nr:serine hydrolase [Deltaproteobacteria bacterium]